MRRTLHCSFCGKSEAEIEKLAAGPGGVHICNECVAVCDVIMRTDSVGPSCAFDPGTWPQERLIALLGPLNATAVTHREHLQRVVDALRSQEVSWSAIGQALGVSGQMAWERFG
ncbi:ClpX C4-type zinc finger protein [Muricoccus pecuniae]|uniref:ClpX C4-type zinc finger protein n=1 Tax=Muricoccus pecuniae TaxID=693023 RepID=UPI00160A5810